MASTAVVTEDKGSRVGTLPIKRFTVLITSHTDGTVADTLKDADENNIKFNGMLVRATIDPAAAPDDPDDNYVMTLKDDNLVDVLANQGAALDEATTTDFVPGETITDSDGGNAGVVPFSVVGELDLACSGMGSANKTTLTLYFS